MFTPHGRLYGYRYLGNTSKKEVHDLDNETENCQIQEIIDARHTKFFSTLEQAHTLHYDNCHYCIGGSKR